jgi:hypothetical protein
MDTRFHLTGGTAASRGYLQHRFSDDLDLFVNDDDRFRLWAERIVQMFSQRAGWRTEILLRQERFLRLTLASESALLKIELVNDVPSRVGEPWLHPTLGRLDTAENILANNVSALIDREEPKDLADIWGFALSQRAVSARGDNRRSRQGRSHFSGRSRALALHRDRNRLADGAMDRGAARQALSGRVERSRRKSVVLGSLS